MSNVKGGRYVESLYYAIRNPQTGEMHYPSSHGNWRFSRDRVEQLLANSEIYFGQDGTGRPKLKRFLCDIREGVSMGTIWDDVALRTAGTGEMKGLFGSVNTFDTAKPEELIQRVLDLGSREGDIVLDFCLGSGTTAAVAHKMGRQYIGVEQMDYITTIPVERLKKVIAGEQGGVSKAVNWLGGGEFIYCELLRYNETWMERIQAAQTSDALLELWGEMAEGGGSFLKWYVNAKAPEQAMDDFVALGTEPGGLDKQKHLLAALLDKNQLYVNLSEIGDERYGVSDEDKRLNRAFYGGQP